MVMLLAALLLLAGLGESLAFLRSGLLPRQLTLAPRRSSSTADRLEQVKSDYRLQLVSSAEVNLPLLSRSDKEALLAGERVQKVDRRGHAGYGLVVLDVPAPPDVVFDVLTQFDQYMEMIPTVRSVRIFSSNDKNTLVCLAYPVVLFSTFSTGRNLRHSPSTPYPLSPPPKAEFSLSKFGLKVNVMQTVLRELRVVKFSLDNSTSTNLVLRQAEGFWHVQQSADRAGYSRVYLSTNIVVSRLIPSVIVDYAAARALPRATTWLLDRFGSGSQEETYLG